MAEDKLVSFQEIVLNKIFRIPDYQRGYAWGNKQLIDFWQDLLYTIQYNRKNHYTGLISLEPVPSTDYRQWLNDKWRINQGATPYYVVDGQQRLTTCFIFLQTLVELAESLGITNLKEGVTIKWIKNNYIISFNNDSENPLYSFVFGYANDESTSDFLINEIFENKQSHSSVTAYSANLKRAKHFFKENLKQLVKSKAKEEIQNLLSSLYETLAIRFVFKQYIIGDDLDVYVSFETMNNRGKNLSTLELLKNRLIYLSTLFGENQKDGREQLRKDINTAWRRIYQYLGKNEKWILSDDDFLRNHWIMYFPYSRKGGREFKSFLLDSFFVPQRVLVGLPTTFEKAGLEEASDELSDEYEDSDLESTDSNTLLIEINSSQLTIAAIKDYVKSLEESAKHWFYIHNPTFSDSSLSSPEKQWLERLNRLGFAYFKPLILASFFSSNDNLKRSEFFQEVERYNFLLFRVSMIRSNTGDSRYYGYARMHYGKTLKANERQISIDTIVANMQDAINRYCDSEKFQKFIKDNFERNWNGFYGWGGLKYFLYEYELQLQIEGSHSQKLIQWDNFTIQKEKSSIEHIYPQTPNDHEWPAEFASLSAQQKAIVQNSLGNLLPLKLTKNIQQQNHSFKDKILGESDGNKIAGLAGYSIGSYSEQEVVVMARDYIWDISKIRTRGYKLLKFLNKRWKVNLFVDDSQKDTLLGINYILPETVS